MISIYTDTNGNTQTLIYHVVEHGTNRVVRTYPTLRAARRLADKLDLEYGAIHYFVQAVTCDNGTVR